MVKVSSYYTTWCFVTSTMELELTHGVIVVLDTGDNFDIIPGAKSSVGYELLYATKLVDLV